jgi:hypothetical protein
MDKAKKPNEWMALVKKVRNENPGMALKDVLRLASKMRGKSSSGKSSSGKRKQKRGGMLLPMLGGETVAEGAEGAEGTEGAAEEVAEPGAQEGAGRKSKKRSKKAKKSRKSKSRSKRRH